jgi:hypothetical protein
MKPIRFLLSFVALSLPLTWWWIEWGLAAYAPVFKATATAIYQALGLGVTVGPGRMRFINFIPFLVLVLLTPRLSLRRRFGGLAIGLVCLMASHIALDLYATYTLGPRRGAHLPPAAAMVSDALPLVLWAVIARDFVREVTGPLFGRTQSAEPDSGDA